MTTHRDIIEIAGQEVILKVNGLVSKRIPVANFVKALQNSGDLELFPGIFPQGVKYVVRR